MRSRLRRTDQLAIHRDEPPALLARGLCQQLLQPGTQVPDARRGDQGHLISPALPEDTQDRPQHRARVLFGRDTGGASVHHLLAPIQEPPHVQPHDGCRHQAEVR